MDLPPGYGFHSSNGPAPLAHRTQPLLIFFLSSSLVFLLHSKDPPQIKYSSKNLQTLELLHRQIIRLIGSPRW